MARSDMKTMFTVTLLSLFFGYSSEKTQIRCHVGLNSLRKATAILAEADRVQVSQYILQVAAGQLPSMHARVYLNCTV